MSPYRISLAAYKGHGTFYALLRRFDLIQRKLHL